ncbi:MAG: hypothetical protein KF744_15585 [Taibaiella sp.]|nr:hypothetical protein [Taibaiella sp.]
MKKIITTLVCLAFVSTGVEAQDNCKVVAKTTASKMQSPTCNLVPKRVCQISGDRTSVMCYNTVNMETLEPFGRTWYYYGPTGPTPERIEFETKTLIIKGQPVKPSCSRNVEERTTTCYLPGLRLHRDPLGNWGYVPDQNGSQVSDNGAKPKYNTVSSVVYK